MGNKIDFIYLNEEDMLKAGVYNVSVTYEGDFKYVGRVSSTVLKVFKGFL